MKSLRIKLLLQLVFFTLGIPVCAEDQAMRDAKLLIVINTQDNTTDEYVPVIEDIVRIEFEQLRLPALIYCPENEADFILTGIYSQRGGMLQIEFEWYDVGYDTVTETVSAEVTVNLSLDQQISRVVKGLAEKVRSRIEEFPFMESEVSDENAVTEETGPAAGEEDTEEQITATEIPDEEIPPNDEITGPSGLYEISAVLSPFISVGTVSDFFQLGFLAEVYCDFIFLMDSGNLAAGPVFGLNTFSVEATGTGPHFMIPVGFHWAYMYNFTEKFDFFVRIALGPSFFVINLNEETLAKTVFFLSGALGLDFQFFEMFLLAINAGYYVFFEKESPVMGFTPGISFKFRTELDW